VAQRFPPQLPAACFFPANAQNTPYETHLASAAAGLMHARARMPRKMRWTMQSAQQTNARRIYFPAEPPLPRINPPAHGPTLGARSTPTQCPRHMNSNCGHMRHSHTPNRFNAAAAIASPCAAARR